ncbi:hypothetical protein UFOVP622_46 [uncultured Caudovirales phage]|uniref:Uncharacterized protein n=1 Tax=uncultured Caudovirales phage TaxID=2100421 RepID=A0A6J5N2Z9_9CAUD|nr:hypothetical protein UFOVP622_46 [uncultured Caudovirales phage]
MKTEEIYKLASEITEKEFNNVLFKFNKTELELFNCLVQLGDTKEVALFTVISEKYENKKAIQIQD